MRRALERALVVTVVALAVPSASIARPAQGESEAAPTFEPDRSWPKPLPNNWRLGIVWAVSVDSRDHVWVLHAAERYLEEMADEGKVPAPPVVEFDREGNLVQAWGGRDQGRPWVFSMEPHPFVGEHGLHVDHRDNVWVTGGGHLALKFTRAGEFRLQIGRLNRTAGSNHTAYLGNPSGVDVDPESNEVYIADGYLNKRVIVFDGDSGKYVRHWGRYGEPPDDDFEAGERFPRYAHAAQLSNDGLLYVSDREHSSIHVHRRDGSFVSETPLPVKVNSVAFSADPDQHYLYAGGMRTGANGRYDLNTDGRIVILRRRDLQVLGSFESAGQHFFDVDSQGDISICGRSLPERFVPTSRPVR